MAFNFDQIIDRRCTDSVKWHHYGENSLPMWVADMDFQSPPEVIAALQNRVEHGIFGYPQEDPELKEIIAARLLNLYKWEVSLESIILLPGVITGFNLVCQSLATPGDGVLIQTPVYPPILAAAQCAQLCRDEMQLTHTEDGQYEIDLDLFEGAIQEHTKVFLLCNPHNPVGRVFNRFELEAMAEICLRNQIIICSDEIHCDLTYTNNQHIPIASLNPDIAANTITLMAPSKTFNIAGLECAFAVIQNPEIRRRFMAERQRRGLVGWVNIFGLTAAKAAFQYGQPWLSELLKYLEMNRDVLCDYVKTNLPGIRVNKPEATFLAWLDCRQVDIPGNPHHFFLKSAGVAMNDGTTFGQGGEGFLRLNFGCPRSVMLEGLQKLKTALDEKQPTFVG